MQRRRRLCIRVSEEEEAILKEAAWMRKLSLSEYVRRVMLREARQPKRPDVS